MAGKSKRKGYQSNGIVGGPTSGILSSMRAARGIHERALNKIRAWRAGQNPWLTIESTSKDPKNNQKTYRVKANDYWGNPKQAFNMASGPQSE
jgi:hypothetical protein